MKLSPLFSFPPELFDWAEGIAYSSDGKLLAVAELNGDRVALVSEGGLRSYVNGPKINSPHDVAFSKDDMFLAVANRGNTSVTIHWRLNRDTYEGEPSRILKRPEWIGTTAVTFDPSGERVVVVDHNHTVTCFELDGTVVWMLLAAGFSMPDGITFSHDGRLLAIANNLSHDVTLYEKDGEMYNPAPVARLGGLRHPHSMAFTEDDEHLIVTNSGGPDITVFRRDGREGWTELTKWPACRYETFLEAHYAAYLKCGKEQACEGGAKGIALHGNRLAWSGPNIGVQVHEVSFAEESRP